MSKKVFEFILSASSVGWQSVNKARQGLNAFNKEVGSGSKLMESAKSQVTALVGAYLGFNALSNTASIIKSADTAVFGLQSSLTAANREFSDIGSMEEWGQTIDRLSKKLRIYSKTDLQEGAARTIDMTKRLGLSAKQMEEVIARSADLSAGKTTLEGAIERVTSALRGEAEASEFLGLTLNENYVTSWYNAAGATEGAWKNLTVLQKAQIRYQVFLEQAIPLQGRAADSIKTFGGAYAFVKTNIEDAITGNKDMIEVTKDLAKYLSENADDIGSMATSIASAAAESAKWVIENRELIATLGKWAIGLYLVTKPITVLIGLVKGLQAAAVAMTGTSLITWLGTLRAATTGIALGMGATFAATMGVAGAFVFAALQIKQLIDNYYELKQLNADIEAQTRANATANKQLADRFKEISTATGVTVTSMQELDKAVKDGRIQYDQTVGAWVKGSATMSAAAAKSAAEQKATVVKVTDEMKKAYQKYADEVRRIQGDIANGERSLAAQLREMARTGMSDVGAWQDRKREAGEYFEASKKALAEAEAALKADDDITAEAKFVEAKQMADESRAAYAELNKAVESNGQVVIDQQTALKTAMSGVKESGELGIEILKRQKDAAIAAGQALDTATGGQLSKDLPEAAKAFGELSKKAEDLGKKSAEFNEAWNKAWDDFLKDGNGAIYDLDTKLSQLTKDRHIKVYVQEVTQKALGGMVGVPGFAVGGSPANIWQQFRRLSNPLITSGSGLRDDVPAMLKKYEFVQPSESVRYYGWKFMEMIRRRLLPKPMGFASGGSPAGPVSLAGAGAGGGNFLFYRRYQFYRSSLRAIPSECPRAGENGFGRTKKNVCEVL